MYNRTHAMLTICTRNEDRSAAAVHRVLNHPDHPANIVSETSVRQGDVFVINILFELDLTSLLELGATCDELLKKHVVEGSRPQLVRVDDARCTYDEGAVAVIDCYVNDQEGLATELSERVHRSGADIYQMVCYSTDAPMQGTKIFVAQVKVHLPSEVEEKSLKSELDALVRSGWDISLSCTKAKTRHKRRAA